MTGSCNALHHPVDEPYVSFIRVTPEQRRQLACAADRDRTPAEADVLARLDDEQGMHASALVWRTLSDLTPIRGIPEQRRR